MTVNFAHCFFEQSGTFKKAFQALGVPAKDYDIQNDFGETDVVVDIFSQIDEEYYGINTQLFAGIDKEDLIIAFFPCIYFCEMSSMYFMGVSHNQRNLSFLAKIENIIEREEKRHNYYVLLLKLFHVCERKHLRLIVENPYNAHHYLRFNFPCKPAIIDMNRRLKGDNVKKPTQYFFLNCEPAGKMSIQFDKKMEYTRDRKSANKAGICSKDRSMIHSDYAHNFICDHILGIDSGHTQPLLFND